MFLNDKQISELKSLADYINNKLSHAIIDFHFNKFNELIIKTETNNLHEVILFLKIDNLCKFSQLVEITAVDFPSKLLRFEVNYFLLSIQKNWRVRVVVEVADQTTVPSIIDIYACANWFERETWDMYGIVFDNHPNLTRILTDYDFEGHPLRKDFPLTGYVEISYNKESKQVEYVPVNLVQDFRDWDFVSPWESNFTSVSQADDEDNIKQ